MSIVEKTPYVTCNYTCRHVRLITLPLCHAPPPADRLLNSEVLTRGNKRNKHIVTGSIESPADEGSDTVALQ